MAEIWVPVRDWEGYYEASSLGRIRSIDRVIEDPRRPKGYFRKGKVLNQNKHLKNGYEAVNLRNPASQQYVHRLICSSFHGTPPEGKTFVRHLNGDRQDNRIGNLAWGSRSENAQDAIQHGTNANARKTHCKNGHEFTEENTAVTDQGRRCKECSRVNALKQAARLRMEKKGGKDS